MYPTLLERDFTADEPGTKFVGDITYIRTRQGWLYCEQDGRRLVDG